MSPFRTEKDQKLDNELIKCSGRKNPDLKESGLKKIQNVSFPRSGHALLRRCLQLYFGEKFVFCEFYSGCKTTPCINPQTNYQKNHDFDLKLVNDPTLNYIIQYRHPMESLVSYYTQCLDDAVFEKDDRRQWAVFCADKLDVWKRFVSKWVTNNNNPNTLYVPFSDLIDNPETKLKEIIKYMDPLREPDTDRISEVVDEMNITPRSSIHDFKYYDRQFFKETEKMVLKEMGRLGINPVFNKRKIPVFYHVPRCAGTFIAEQVMWPSLVKEHRENNKKLKQENKPIKYSKIHRFDLDLNDSLKFPGDVSFSVSLDHEKLTFPTHESAVTAKNLKEYLKKDWIYIRGIVINPVSNGIMPYFSLIEEICQNASCEPYYFTVLRKPFDWHQSMFYYLRDVGTWEPTHGRFTGMSFSDYINSDLISDSWIIRNLTGLPDNKSITKKEYDEVVQLLSRFTIGFLDDMPTLLGKLREEFGFLVHDVETEEDLTNKNKISRKEHISELSGQDIKTFNERTEYDTMLYDHFKVRLRRVYTYYDDLDCYDDARKQIYQGMINEWKKSWSRAGWDPVVLSRKDAEAHPYFPEYSALIKASLAKKQNLNPENYELACFIRWLAVANKGGGFMCDYDVLNKGFKPGQRFPDMLTCYQRSCPSLVSGAAHHFLHACRIFATCDPHKAGACTHNNIKRHNFSDQYTISNIFTENDIIRKKVVVPFSAYTKMSEQEKENVQLIHFSTAGFRGDRGLRLNAMKEFNDQIDRSES